jgi:hypothetical protein
MGFSQYLNGAAAYSYLGYSATGADARIKAFIHENDAILRAAHADAYLKLTPQHVGTLADGTRIVRTFSVQRDYILDSYVKTGDYNPYGDQVNEDWLLREYGAIVSRYNRTRKAAAELQKDIPAAEYIKMNLPTLKKAVADPYLLFIDYNADQERDINKAMNALMGDYERFINLWELSDRYFVAHTNLRNWYPVPKLYEKAKRVVEAYNATREASAKFDVHAFAAANRTTVNNRINVLNKRWDYEANNAQWRLAQMNEQERLRQQEYARQIEEQDRLDRIAADRRAEEAKAVRDAQENARLAALEAQRIENERITAEMRATVARNLAEREAQRIAAEQAQMNAQEADARKKAEERAANDAIIQQTKNDVANQVVKTIIAANPGVKVNPPATVIPIVTVTPVIGYQTPTATAPIRKLNPGVVQVIPQPNPGKQTQPTVGTIQNPRPQTPVIGYQTPTEPPAVTVTGTTTINPRPALPMPMPTIQRPKPVTPIVAPATEPPAVTVTGTTTINPKPALTMPVPTIRPNPAPSVFAYQTPTGRPAISIPISPIETVHPANQTHKTALLLAGGALALLVFARKL